MLKINGIDLCTLILSSHTSRYHATEWKYFLLEVRHHDPMNHKASETSVIIIMTSQKQPHALHKLHKLFPVTVETTRDE